MERSLLERAVAVRTWLAAGIAIASCAGALVIARGPGRYTTYAGISRTGTALMIAAVVALVCGGLVAGQPPRRLPHAYLAIAAAFSLTCGVWMSWQSGPPIIPSLAMLFTGLTFPMLLHLVLGYVGDQAGGKLGRALVWLAYAEATLVAVVLAVVRDPYFDRSCLANCTVNAFLIWPLPAVGSATELVDRWLVAALAVSTIAVLAAALAKASVARRRTLLAVGLPAMGYLGAIVGHAIVLERVGVDDPANTALFGTFIAQSVALVLLGGGLIWIRLRSGAQRTAVQRIVVNLGQAPAPGTMQAALADTLGDRQLRIAYWLEASGRYVDAYGKPIDPPVSSDGRTITRLLNGDRTIALISHATGTLGDSAQLGPAVRLGLDNESLRAATLGQLEELQASRARLVEAGDTARRRLERDLHDGAQQQLISVTYDIGLARTSATADGDIGTADLLTEASQEAQAGIEALRSVAHGLYPAVLTEGGLVPALQTLAETSALPLEVDGPALRFPAGVEAAAYFAVAGAVEEASTRGATYLTVGIRQERGLLVVAITSDGAAGTVSTAVVDRVGALGGRVRVGDKGSTVEIPCA